MYMPESEAFMIVNVCEVIHILEYGRNTDDKCFGWKRMIKDYIIHEEIKIAYHDFYTMNSYEFREKWRPYFKHQEGLVFYSWWLKTFNMYRRYVKAVKILAL